MSTEDAEEDLRCRICLASEEDELISMFCVASTHNMLISHMILACCGIPITTHENLPQLICNACLGKLDIAYSCWLRCRESRGNYTRSAYLRLDEEDFTCRICIKNDVSELISLYCICDSLLLQIHEIINQFSGLSINQDDLYPQYVCNDCLGELTVGFDFRKTCRKSNGLLRKELQNDPNREEIRKRRDKIIPPKKANTDDQLQSIGSVDEAPLSNLSTSSCSVIDLDQSPADHLQNGKSNDVPNPKQAESNTEHSVQNVSNPKRARPSSPVTMKRHKEKFKPAKTMAISPHVTDPQQAKGNTDTTSTGDELTALEHSVQKDILTDASRPKRARPGSPITLRTHKDHKKPKPTKSKAIPPLGKDWQKVNSPKIVLNPASVTQVGTLIKRTVILERPGKTSDKKRGPYTTLDGNNQNIVKTPNAISKQKEPVTEAAPKINVKLPAGITIRKVKPADNTQISKVENTKVSFSTPSEFKKFTTQLMKKTNSCLLAPAVFRVITNKTDYSWSQIMVFRCVQCNMRYNLNSLGSTCTKCHRIFENYALIKVNKSENHVKLLCCKKCPFFEVALPAVLKHVEIHKKKFPVGAIRKTATMPIYMNEGEVDLPITTGRETDPLQLNAIPKSTPLKKVSTPHDAKSICSTFDVMIELEDQDQLADDDHGHIETGTLETDKSNKDNSNTAEEVGTSEWEEFLDSDQEDIDDFIDISNDSPPDVADEPSPVQTMTSVSLQSNIPAMEQPLPNRQPIAIGPADLNASNHAIFDTLKETEHYKLLLLKGHLCCGCQQLFDSGEDMEAHSKDHHALAFLNRIANAKVYCDRCLTVFRTEAQLSRHRLQGAKSLYYCCKLCRNLMLENEDDFEAHCSVRHSKFRALNSSTSMSDTEILVWSTSD